MKNAMTLTVVVLVLAAYFVDGLVKEPVKTEPLAVIKPMPKDYELEFTESADTSVRLTEANRTIVSFHKDGRVTWDERLTADAAGRAFAIAVKKYWVAPCDGPKAKP